MTDEDLLAGFESLGDNCEFGLVQRGAGVERIGFFRFNFAPLSSLLRALESDFDRVDSPENVELFTDSGNEFMVRICDYRFQYHTDVKHGTTNDDLLRRHLKIIRFLANKFLADLRAAEMIFVRKGHDSSTLTDMKRLVTALHRHGPVTLLWVVPQDETHPAGTVEVVSPHLLRGFIDRFAPYDDAKDWSTCWFGLCRSARKLQVAGNLPGSFLPPERVLPAPNLIRPAFSRAGGGGWHSPLTRWNVTTTIPQPDPDNAILQHTLLQATSQENAAIHGCNCSNGISAGTVYVVSLWVWLPEQFSGNEVGVVLNGFDSIKIVNADIAQRTTWQRVWVTARVPTGVANANPSLQVVGSAGDVLFSSKWRLEMGVYPKDHHASDPPKLRPAPNLAGRQPAHLKWYFTANRATLENKFDQVRAAVASSHQLGNVSAFCVIDDYDDLSVLAGRLAWMEKMGVRLILHRAELFEKIRAHLGPAPESLSDTWLKYDIPLLNHEDEHVLYTDVNVLFRKPFDFNTVNSGTIACIRNYDDSVASAFSDGVLLMNLPALRASRSQVVSALPFSRLDLAANAAELLLNRAYGECWDRLPDFCGWNPAWGINLEAPVVCYEAEDFDALGRAPAGGASTSAPPRRVRPRRIGRAYDVYRAEYEAALAGAPYAM
jgi:hypothetical protein